MYSKEVAPDRRTLRTVFRDTFSSRTISLIDLPLTNRSRLIRAIVSTTNIPCHPLQPRAGQPAHHGPKGVRVGRRSPLHRGQSSTPNHSEGQRPLGTRGVRSVMAYSSGREGLRYAAAAPDFWTAG